MTIRVDFILSQPQTWSAVSSIHASMEQDGRFAPRVVAVPVRHPGMSGALRLVDRVSPFLRAHGIAHVTGRRVRLDNADVTITHNPHDSQLPLAYWARFLSRRSRLVYVPYAFELLEEPYSFFNRPVHQRAWRSFVRSERVRALYRQYCDQGDGHVVVSGQPKLDICLDHAARSRQELLGAAHAHWRAVFFWNPHWSIYRRPQYDSRLMQWQGRVRYQERAHERGWSTFPEMAPALMRAARTYPDCLFIVRPHPMLFSQRGALGLSHEQWQDLMNTWRGHDNIWLHQDPDYLPALMAADALISDASSLTFEFLVSGRPMAYTSIPQGAPLNSEGEMLQHLDPIGNQEDFLAFVDRTLAGDDPQRGARQRLLADFLVLPPEGAGARIAQCIAQDMN